MKLLYVSAAMILSLVASPSSQEIPIMVSPDEVAWMEGPPSLPPGAKMAVLSGDSKKEGLFVMRAKLPAGYKVPPHFHPDKETVTVLSGAFHAAMGDTFDASKLKVMPAGSFLMLPAKNPHFVFTKEETIIQVSAMGPWTLTYVNPADDPRNKK